MSCSTIALSCFSSTGQLKTPFWFPSPSLRKFQSPTCCMEGNGNLQYDQPNRTRINFFKTEIGLLQKCKTLMFECKEGKVSCYRWQHTHVKDCMVMNKCTCSLYIKKQFHKIFLIHIWYKNHTENNTVNIIKTKILAKTKFLINSKRYF